MTAVCETLGVARSNISARVKQRPSRARGRPPLADQELVDAIKTIIDDMPTYGYRRVHAILRRKACSENRRHRQCQTRLPGDEGSRHASSAPHRCNRHPSPRWLRRCRAIQSALVFENGFEIGCDNKEKVRVAFALDCCDRQAIAHVATTEGIKSEDVQDLVITAVENRFGLVNTLPKPNRVADGQRLLLHRKGNQIAAHRYRHGAVFNARSQPPVQPESPKPSSKPSSVITSR